MICFCVCLTNTPDRFSWTLCEQNFKKCRQPGDGSKMGLVLVRDRGEQKSRTVWLRFNCLLNVVRMEKVLKGDEVDGYESLRAIG